MNLLFRTDASVAIGTGHVMRCLALAQAWSDAGGSAIFAVAAATPSVEQRLRSERFEAVPVAAPVGTAADAEETARLAQQHGASWVVLDGYEFGAEYQAVLKSHVLKVLFIDDYVHATHYSADLVLNQNAYASKNSYSSREAYTRLLLGPRFVLLRREFNSWRGWKREIPAVARKVLVTMGGSDPENLTQYVVESILSSDFEMTIVAGGSNPKLSTLRELAGRSSRAVRFVENAVNMPDLIASADLAVAGAGTTSWEMCFLGLPGLLIVLADNQAGVADELGRKGVMLNLGRRSEVSQRSIATNLRSLADSPEIRREMSERGRALVDGRGAERVVCALKRESLSIRLVEEGDCKLLWQWANDPAVRAASFSSEIIPWDEHALWFRRKLRDQNSHILVALDDMDVPVGQMRLDKTAGDEAEVDISLDSRVRGLGYASRLIDLGTTWAFSEWGLARLHAFVKPENVVSAKAFETAGFKPVEKASVNGKICTHYVRTGK